MQQALAAVDDLLAAQAVTLRALALFPAVLLLAGAARVLRSAGVAVSSRSIKTTDDIAAELAAGVPARPRGKRVYGTTPRRWTTPRRERR